MRVLGDRSVASILRIVLELMRIGLLVLAAVIAALALIAGYVYLAGDAAAIPGLSVERLDDWRITMGGFALTGATIAMAMIVVDRLRRIFATLAAGDPFVPENADHLRVIWVAIAVFELARYLVSGVAVLVLHLTEPADVRFAGLGVDVRIWFAVLVIFVLAEVFREGARLRQEQRLTI